jgi:hypothetical protein
MEEEIDLTVRKKDKRKLHSDSSLSVEKRETQSISLYESDKLELKKAEEILKKYSRKKLTISTIIKVMLRLGIEYSEKKCYKKNQENFEEKIKQLLKEND